MDWKLKRTMQCEKCPWRVDTDPYDIPNGYDVDQHRALESTIARPEDGLMGSRHAMACHETSDAHCVGWLMNQLGSGNNISLRILMISCSNAKSIRLRGEQHATFVETLPTQSEDGS